MSIMKVDQHGLLPKFSSLWEDFFGRDVMSSSDWSRRFSVPSANIEEKEGSFEISLAVPGMQREDFKIEVNNGVLTISSEKELKHEEQEQEGKYTRREFSYHTFSRSFALPEAVNEEEITAEYQDGILAIYLPKKASDKQQLVREIAIK